MIKRKLTALLVKILNKLLFINEQNRLKIIYKNPNITVGAGLVIEQYFSADLPADGFKITFGPHVRINKYCHILLFPKAVLNIGENVFFNNYCSINCLEVISIGENTMFGEGVKIYDHNHLYNYVENKLTVEKDQFKTAPVIIGKNCWIGSNVTILKGVIIGDNVIIGANNLIYKSVPDNSIIRLKAAYSIEHL
jgi:acetyltransferase-like isoleucine patch superfamily enzyme